MTTNIALETITGPQVDEYSEAPELDTETLTPLEDPLQAKVKRLVRLLERTKSHLPAQAFPLLNDINRELRGA